MGDNISYRSLQKKKKGDEGSFKKKESLPFFFVT